MTFTFTRFVRQKVLFGLLMAAALLSGCTDSRMAGVKAADALTVPAEDKATIVFYRKGGFVGSGVVAPIFDITDGEPKFVGNLAGGHKIAYHAAATKKTRFMTLGWTDRKLAGVEVANFMDANLSPRKTYFVRVELKRGPISARVSLVPIPATDPVLEEHLRDVTWVKNTQKSRQWALGNMVIFKRKKNNAQPYYEAGIDILTLQPEDGR